jgi:hypothetical protein
LRTREHAEDPAHPLVQDAQTWADAMAEKEVLVMRETPGQEENRCNS